MVVSSSNQTAQWLTKLHYRIPVHMIENNHKLNRISRQMLQRKWVREATPEELAAGMDIPEDSRQSIEDCERTYLDGNTYR